MPALTVWILFDPHSLEVKSFRGAQTSAPLLLQENGLEAIAALSAMQTGRSPECLYKVLDFLGNGVAATWA